MQGFVFRTVRPIYRGTRAWISDLAFEHRYDVDTAGKVTLEELGLAGRGRESYGPSGWLTLRRILPQREVDGDDVFVDLGSGKGRVVLQAAVHYRFGRVIGVEVSPQLNAIARHNIERNRRRLRCPNVELVTSDVVDCSVPDDVTVVFMGNPFSGSIFETAIEGLAASIDRRPRTIRIIYRNPQEERRLLSAPGVRKVRTVRGWRPRPAWSLSNGVRMYEMRPLSSARL